MAPSHEFEKPAAEYLDITNIPSRRVQLPEHAPRKLLILDLNGTLLYRPKRVRHASSTPGELRVRPVRIRPYIPSFREYLFHPRTRVWLDTMVWSSARPFNVADMVEHCFPNSKDRFQAIWARDTFGLTSEAYGQKVLTVKDLTKIWTTFPNHSAFTTLLLDDSFRKAQRNPWNHLILPEYIAETRARDVAVYSRLSGLSTAAASAAEPQRQNGGGSSVEEASSGQGHPGSSTSAAAIETRVTDKDMPLLNATDMDVYDETLLAVIGILDTLRHESNISGWLRAGSLLHPNSEAREDVSNENEAEDQAVATDHETENERDRPLWFADAAIARAWADKGRNALAELGIDLVDGVKP